MGIFYLQTLSLCCSHQLTLISAQSIVIKMRNFSFAHFVFEDKNKERRQQKNTAHLVRVYITENENSFAGQYSQYRVTCSPSDPFCVPCQDKLPSCVGLPDGDHPFPSRLWKPDYITCYQNRTILPTKKCPKGYFHPLYENCTEEINSSMCQCIIKIIIIINSYCHSDAQNCSQPGNHPQG